MIIMRKELKQQKELLNARKKHSKGKRIALQNKFMFTIEEVLEIAKKAESVNAAKNTRKRPRRELVQEDIADEDLEASENNSDSSESDCIVVMPRK